MVKKSRTKSSTLKKTTSDPPASAQGELQACDQVVEKAGTPDKLDLLDAAPDDADSALRVSEKFAKKYNERKDRVELARAKRILAEEDVAGASGSSSDSEPEDEGATMLTPQIESKIFDTLKKIKSKDPSIYDNKTVFFDDKDFEDRKASSEQANGSSKKGVHLKDFIRNTLLTDGADALVRAEDELEAKKKKRTPLDEQQALKKDIINAAHADDDGGGSDEDDLFSLKTKSTDEEQREKLDFDEFMKRKDASREGRGEGGDEIMAQYWKADEDLGDEERFLRDYILNKAWLETASMQQGGDDVEADDKDEEHLEEADEFEKEYNFRFEMEDGAQIQGHARFPENSVRERGDKRKRQRQQRAERQDAEKVRRTEEIKRLKNLKKQEIQKRLEQLQEITGNEEPALNVINLDEDFDPSKHDVDMGKLFDDEYDNKEEPLAPEELVKAPDGYEDLDVSAASGEALERARKRGKTRGKTEAEPQTQDGPDDSGGGVQEDEEEWVQEDEEEADPELWFLCDGCQKGIPGGKRRFDCTVCENYSLCVPCFRVRRHPHKFVRKRVPDGCMPPEDLKDLQASRPDMEQILEEYNQLDCEDIIGGDLPTRFKYRSVEKNSFGLSPDEILSKTDKQLNSMVSLKKLRPHRTDVDAGEPRRPRNDAGARNPDDKQKWQHHRKGGGAHMHQGKRKQTPKRKETPAGVSSQRLEAYNFGDRGGRKDGQGGKRAKNEQH